MEARTRSSSLDESDLNSLGQHHSNAGGQQHGGRHASFAAGMSDNNNNNATKSSTQARRLYRTAANKSLSVTREIAALDFLVGIPLEAEGKIVREGWIQERRLQREESKTEDSEANDDGSYLGAPTSLQGKWWEKWIKPSNDTSWSQNDPTRLGKSVEDRDNAELERPEAVDRGDTHGTTSRASASASVWQAYAPGRRLEGDDAICVKIPVTTKTLTKQRSIARQAALREWESQTAHGIVDDNDGKMNRPPLADGRLFFSAAGAYPVSAFSMIRYEPRKEEQQLRRQKLEALGGGGSQFVPPTRDWRGVSYRSLLPRKRQNISSFFNRFRSEEIADFSMGKYNKESPDDEDNSSTSSSSSDDSDDYQTALLDDPEMKLGRHRNVIIGDKALGPIVSSTIQFVEPRILKAELNRQFRERFDGWEPPRGARKYIGAKVVNGEYKLMDPTMEYGSENDPAPPRITSERSVASEKDTVATTTASTTKEMLVRMPPSLTLSKIRSLKHQALIAAVKAKLEIGTVALACVYFERLCLDCRVDKSNRRLTFAVCMLLAAKLNEPNVGLVMKQEKVTPSEEGEGIPAKLHHLVRPNERSNDMFESLLGFFTQDWNLSLKRIFDAEWGVFAALGFSLHANPSHVAFHFKRMMKTLEWNIRDYLGRDMHDKWLRALEVEEDRQRERVKRKERKRREREERILNLRIEIENEVIRRKTEEREEKNMVTAGELSDVPTSPDAPGDASRKKAGGANVTKVKTGGMRFLSRMRRVTSSGKVTELAAQSNSEHAEKRRRGSAHAGVHLSPSLPALSSMLTEISHAPLTNDPDTVAIDIPIQHHSTNDDQSLGSLTMEGDEGALLV
eukprot:scaffold2252_cov150-Amphora_coffeaeformis.AAC.4